MTFKTEAELCSKFIEYAAGFGWTAYPETCDWDILLVRDGIQIGVQAKLRANYHVLMQAMPDNRQRTGPHYRSVLVGRDVACFSSIAGGLGLIAFEWKVTKYDAKFFPPVEPMWWWVDWGIEPHTLPAFVPDVAAGTQSPVKLTEWKIKALRVCARIEVNGVVTVDDFKQIGIDRQRWVASNWVLVTDKRGVYKRGHHVTFDAQHPKVYQEILEQERERKATLSQ